MKRESGGSERDMKGVLVKDKERRELNREKGR